MEYLPNIHSPEDLRVLPESALETVSKELREYLLDSLNTSGGHMGAGLGVVELTVALHYVYNTPIDNLIWDVGHQAYPHKILTGRRAQIQTIRHEEGLAPFPERNESPFDAFGVGHSSTSIGAALGMAWANQHSDAPEKANVAIIGDGGMTAGMAFEALNHAGVADTNMLVILNDNDMSISRNVGALSNYFARILSSRLYTSMREGSKKMLGRVPPVWEFARRTESHLKGMVAPGTLFEELGFNYIGPIDGHDVLGLVRMLRNIQAFKGPQLLHIITQKGRGYKPAEGDPIRYHAVSPAFIAPKTEATKASPKPPSFSDVFGQWLCDAAEKDTNVVGITPAMREGSGMVSFAEKFPEQYVDVGIAEQHAVTFAAGLACEGKRPVVAIYSSFLQRAYDQFIHDVALQNLPVLLAIDRAGLVPDGPTHNGAFDLSFLRCIPNLVLMTPSDEQECHQLLWTGLKHSGPAAVRYPRGHGTGKPVDRTTETLPIGKARSVRTGKNIAFLNFGTLLPEVEQAAAYFGATVVDMRFVKPLDTEMVEKIAATHKYLVTVEENVVMGGAGSAVNECLLQLDIQRPVLNLGYPDTFIQHGNPNHLCKQLSLDSEGIIKQVEQKFGNKTESILGSALSTSLT